MTSVELAREWLKLRQRVEELERAPRCCADTIPPGCRTCRCTDAAEAKLAKVVEALIRAEEWMSDKGCDCGADEPGTCALCVAEAALVAAKGEK